jgi:hypothetical protein
MTARVHFTWGAPLLIIGLVTLVMFIFVLVDMVRRPDWQWRQAGSSKTMWIVLEVLLFVLFGFLSIISGIVYLASARPKLVAAERAGRAGDGGGYSDQWGGGPYQTPPSGWGAPPPGGYGATGPPPGSYGEQGPPPYPGTPGAQSWPGVTTQVPASWQPDPSHRHELRYWDGTEWTEHVADAGQQSTDPLPT